MAHERESRHFVDECQLNVRGGDGGAGCVSMRREAHVPRGGPDGGDGGRGGDIWLVADRNVASLRSYRDHPHRNAENGTHGRGNKQHGASGVDLELPVPEGTVVHDEDGEVLADLATHRDRWLAAVGGRGGRGNARFLSNRRRAPTFAEQGERGEQRWLRLELKLMADVALVGFPNVGKSTLISRISAAKPKIGDYPFTTLEPNLGVVRAGDVEFVVADVPGLIEGASDGRGLGLAFLRHIERARVLVLLLDVGPASALASDEQERVLLDELNRYKPELLDRPRIVIGSKADLAGVSATDPTLRVSSVTGEGIEPLVREMASAVTRARAAVPVREGYVIHRPVPDGFRIAQDVDGAFVVTGRAAERAVALSDLTNIDALDFAHYRLRKLGVDRALARAGAKDGDVVRIGGLSFDYRPDG